MTQPASFVNVQTYTSSTFPAELSGALGKERLALWTVDRSLWSPRLFTAVDDVGGVIGAALTAGRPFCAYRKIVDVVAGSDDVWEQLVVSARMDGLTSDNARNPRPVVVHFEEHVGISPLTEARASRLERLGFERVRQPVPSVSSTRSGGDEAVAGWSWWPHGSPQRLAPYYGQTTDVTCGAAAAMMGLELLGRDILDEADLHTNRASEIAFWRQATNLPACEPIGLALETARSGAAVLKTRPRVVLSVDGPILLESFSKDDWEYELRADLQSESLRQALEAGIPIERRWIEATEIADLVRAGAKTLLLIDLTELIADPTPHWVLATDVLDDTMIVSDPWIQRPNGETWVDTFALPMPLNTVDRVTRWGEPVYRGIIVFE